MRQEAVAEYRAASKRLIERVDGALMANPELSHLIGGNPVEMMQLNHRHHHMFVADMLELDAPELFDAVVPWVYRTYRAHGFSFDYFPLEFKAWESALAEELSPASAADILEFYKRFSASHAEMVRKAAAPAQEADDEPSPFAEEIEQMTRALLEGNATRVLVLGQPYSKSVDGIIGLYSDIIAPALHRIGEMWGHGEISVAHEHLASGLVNRAMSYWYVEALKCPKRGGRALFSTAPGELHSIAVNMLADIFTADGWEVINLGADTPAGDIGLMASEFKPDVVGVSVSMPFNLVAAKGMISRVRKLGNPDAFIVAGGQAVALAPPIADKIGADSFAYNAREALAVCRAFCPPHV